MKKCQMIIAPLQATIDTSRLKSTTSYVVRAAFGRITRAVAISG
jgi:hypothetical protein